MRQLPPASVREAVLNGLAHRDRMLPDPVTITWVQADSAMQVISPGGFSGGVTAETVLTQRYARHPALADLFRALGLVDEQGLGVDRMYREMVVLGTALRSLSKWAALGSACASSVADPSSR